MLNAQVIGAASRPGSPAPPATKVAGTHLLCFRSLYLEGRSLAFQCDAHGHIDLNILSPRALSNYLFARAMVGRDFERPTCRSA